MSKAFEESTLSLADKLDGFEKYVRRQQLSRFLARYELFKLNKDVKGSIVECGVYQGAGVIGWAKISAMLEPHAFDRRVFGFDTFEGFPEIVDKDLNSNIDNPNAKESGLNTGKFVYQDIKACIDEFDQNRYLNHFNKIELTKGDAVKTIPEFIKKNPHLIVSMLFMDFDIYEPTKIALKYFLPRMPKGAILAFDEINNPWWPGETLALLETMGDKFNNLEIKRFNFDPSISYIKL
jgi:hypothetical protein